MKSLFLAIISVSLVSTALSEPKSKEDTTTVAPTVVSSVDTFDFTERKAPPQIEALLEVKKSVSSMVAELERIDVKEWTETVLASPNDFVSFKVSSPSRSLANDAFHHEIYYNVSNGAYWVVRTGGYFGVYQVFGPGKLDSK